MRQTSQKVAIAVQLESDAADLGLPSYATEGSAGMDLCANLPEDAPVTLLPGERTMVSTGIRIALPVGYEAQVRPRSGLAHRHGLAMVNSPGTVDSDYRGVVKVLLINLGQESVTIRRGDRVAQLIIAPVARAVWELMDCLPETARGDGGFGSTGS